MQRYIIKNQKKEWQPSSRCSYINIHIVVKYYQMPLIHFSHQPWWQGRTTYLTAGPQEGPRPEIQFVNILKKTLNLTKGPWQTCTLQIWAFLSRLPFMLLQRGGVMQQQRWHHRYLRMLLPPPSSLLSRHLQPSSAFITSICSSAPFPSSSPLFFISCQMISETSLIPRPTASSFPSISRAHSLIVCPSFTLSFVSVPLSPSTSLSPLPTFLFSPCYSPPFYPYPTSLSPLLPLFGINILLFSEPFCFTASHPLNPLHFHLIFSITLP